MRTSLTTLEVKRAFIYIFSGDNFHEIVLENKTEIMKQFKTVTAITKIENIEDSIKLG